MRYELTLSKSQMREIDNSSAENSEQQKRNVSLNTDQKIQQQNCKEESSPSSIKNEDVIVAFEKTKESKTEIEGTTLDHVTGVFSNSSNYEPADSKLQLDSLNNDLSARLSVIKETEMEEPCDDRIILDPVTGNFIKSINENPGVQRMAPDGRVSVMNENLEINPPEESFSPEDIDDNGKDLNLSQN